MHSLFLYQKSHLFAELTSSICGTSTTCVQIPYEALSMWYCVYYIQLTPDNSNL